MISKNTLRQIRLLEQKKHRLESGLFVAEGPKVVGDLLRSGYRSQQLFATRNFLESTAADSLRHLLPEHLLTEVSDDELRRLSFLQHPQHVLAVFPLPDRHTVATPSGLCLALDGVQDPGNLGTIIRIADWFGIRDIYCSPDTADAWNPKVVQATMGSIARVRLCYTDLASLISQTTLPVYGTLLDGTDIYQQQLSADGIIVMGNEGNGISPALRPLITRRLLIPSYRQDDTAESLNVAIATAITCAEFRRR